MSNIFDNLIRNEDTFTDGLVNIIDFSEEFRGKFFGLLREQLELKKSFKLDNYSITTQVVIDGKRPDIVIKMGEDLLIIEVKIENGTGLQNVQKRLYDNCFKVEKYKGKKPYFLFLIPKRYPKRNELEKIIKENSTGVKTGIEEGITAGIIDWEQIIEKCFKPILGENEVRDKVVETVEWFIVNQYHKLLKEKLNIMDIKFEENEKSMVGQKEMISAYIKLYWLPQQIKNQKSNWKFTINGNESAIKLWIDKSQYSGTSIGFIIKKNDDGKKLSDYFEIRVWNKPISPDIKNEYKLEDIKDIEANKENNVFCYGFLPESIDEKEELSQQLIKILEKIMEDRDPKKD